MGIMKSPFLWDPQQTDQIMMYDYTWDTCFFFFSFSEMSARLLHKRKVFLPENQGDFPNQIFDEFSMNDVGPCLG